MASISRPTADPVVATVPQGGAKKSSSDDDSDASLDIRIKSMFKRAIVESSRASMVVVPPMPLLARDVNRIVRLLEVGCRTVAYEHCERSFVDPASDDEWSAGFFTNVYSCYAYKIADLLRDPEHELLRAIMDKRVKAESVASMNMIELAEVCPSILKEERREIALRRAQKTEQVTSTLYECKKCHARRAIVSERQVRSSDEAPTCFIECVNCQYRWTQNK
jgi:DNA-directed RNA polymerase subunit M/transcription elongation factor TFIIS